MGQLIFITGGARSGKSTYAENLARESGKPVAYIATAIAFDDGMKDRIAKHQAQRPDHWGTIEQYKEAQQQPDLPLIIRYAVTPSGINEAICLRHCACSCSPSVR